MSRIKDISLAPSGEMKINWVERNMPVLRGIGEDFKREKPFAGMKVALSFDIVEEKSAPVVEYTNEFDTLDVLLIKRIYGERLTRVANATGHSPSEARQPDARRNAY